MNPNGAFWIVFGTFYTVLCGVFIAIIYAAIPDTWWTDVIQGVLGAFVLFSLGLVLLGLKWPADRREKES